MPATHLRSPSLCVAFLCVVAAGAAASLAAAHQDARGPQPIRSSELERYGDLLQLSDEQRFAVEGLYESYLDEYEPLRWEIIELAVRYPRGHMLRRDEEEEFTRRLPTFVGRARSLDEELFARIEPLLTKEQRESLPRIRMMRERSIYANLDAVKRFIGDGIPDLAALLDGLDVDPGAIDAHLAALLTYEDRLTRGLRGVFEAVVRLCGEGDEKAAELLVERVRSLRSMNRNMYNTLRALLPQHDSRRLREEFFVHAYGGMLFTARCYIQPECEAALALPDMTPDEHEAILRIRYEAIAHQDRVLEELADAADALAISVYDFESRRRGPMVPPAVHVHMELLNATMREMERRHREASREFIRILGPERARAIRQPAEFHHRSDQTGIVACGVEASPTRLYRDRDTAAAAERRRFNPLVPAPISGEDLREFMIVLELNDHDWEILRGIHSEYEGELSAYLREVRHAQIRLTSPNVSDLPWQEREVALAERRRAGQALRAQARATVEQSDARFFEHVRAELEIAEDDLRLLRLRLLRSRTRMLASSMAQRHPNFSGEFDFMPLLIRLRLSEDQWNVIDEHAEHYERRMFELLRAQLDAIHLAHEPLPEGNQPHLEVMRRAEAIHDAHAAVAGFNQAMIELFTEALPPDLSASLLDEFNRRAFPAAFADPANMERAIAQAAILPDLSAAARDAVTEIRNDFAAAYEDVRMRIVDLCGAYEPYLIVEGISIRSRPENEEAFAQAFAVLSDERAAVNRRALRGLRTALTPAQLRRLDLPQVE